MEDKRRENIFDRYDSSPVWAGIGTDVEGLTSSREVIEKAGLDYNVIKEPIDSRADDGEIIHTSSRFYKILREDNGTILGTVGRQYMPLQNRDAFRFFDRIVEAGKAEYFKAGHIDLGTKVWIIVKMKDSMNIAKDDVVDKYLVLVNSFDGTSAVDVFFTPYRLWCSNMLTMAYGKSEDKVKIRHTGVVNDKIIDAERTLSGVIKFYDEFENVSRRMVKRQLSKVEVDNYFNRLVFAKGKFDKEKTQLVNKKNRLLELFEKGKGNDISEVKGSLWAAYNAVTEFSDHVKTVHMSVVDDTKRIKDSIFGSGAAYKKKSYSLAKEFLGK